jgi:thioredoxin-like negative regulator of GroEL
LATFGLIGVALCRLVSPIITWAAETYSDRLKVVKMEVDPNPATVKQYQVEGVPALRLFQGTQVLESSEGAIGKQKLISILDTHLEGLGAKVSAKFERRFPPAQSKCSRVVRERQELCWFKHLHSHSLTLVPYFLQVLSV